MHPLYNVCISMKKMTFKGGGHLRVEYMQWEPWSLSRKRFIRRTTEIWGTRCSEIYEWPVCHICDLCDVINDRGRA